jgi:hypothetical protein
MRRNGSPIIAMALLTICSFTAGKPEWKKVSNKLYSFSAPKEWIQLYPENQDGIPGERDARIPVSGTVVVCRLYYLSMSSPYKNENEFFNATSLYVQSYERKDGGFLSVEEIEELEMSGKEKAGVTILEKKEMGANAGQKRFVRKEISDEINAMSGTRHVKRCCFYLLCKSGETVHFVCFSLRESQLNPESQAVINSVLDSFVVK